MLQCNEEVSVNHKLYKIIKLLGHGKGGYSYLAEKDGELVVLKQIHHEPCSYYTFGNKIEAEINDYQRLVTVQIRIPKMIDVDKEKIVELIKSDKKASGNKVTIVYVSKIGSFDFRVIEVDSLKKYLK